MAESLVQFKPANQMLLFILAGLIVTAYICFSQSGEKLRKYLAETVFVNWRLALLGATGIVLSVASGWTTWDGMSNFTKEPLLSLMITFGIQGVMLIVAWLIGESFATGMHRHRSPVSARGRAIFSLEPVLGTVLGILLFAAAALLIIKQTGAADQLADNREMAAGGYLLPTGLLIAAVIILLSINLIINSGNDIAGSYLQAMRIIVRSAVLWVMFLACMATSVFFSFDSLFSAIFPQQERVRAAELRAQNQVAGAITDISEVAVKRRLEEQDRLFLTQAWKSYDAMLERLVVTVRQAPKALQDYFEENVREKQRVVALRQEEKAAAESKQILLKQSIKVLNEKAARAREAIAQLSPVVDDLKNKIFAKDREIVAKKAEAEAEAGGIGVTSKSGRGPKYREIAQQMRILNEEQKNLKLQLDEYEKRLVASREDIGQSETALTTAEAELATLQGQARTADRLIQRAENSTTASEPAFDPAFGLRQLENARMAFRQDPQQAGLAGIQELCNALVGTMSQVPALKSKVVEFDCDLGQVNEASSRIFALNAGLATLQSDCIGGDKLPKTGGADSLFAFARKCVQDARLPSRDTDELRTRINYLELNRDDLAHRFVVTTNAFSDGNKLAYLALAIAIAIDSLVFMSGLFGANAVRSPLTDVPSYKSRSAQQLEAIIDTALQPHPYDTARLVLAALRPITPSDGFTAEVIVDDTDPNASDIRRVLNAGSSIGAVRHGDQRGRVFEVRAEFFEYLSLAAQREYEKDRNRIHIAELERIVSVALLPDIAGNADIVLEYMQPIETASEQENHGFTSEISFSDIEEASGHRKAVKAAMNAGAVYGRVQRAEKSSDHYFIHADFYKVLITLRGRILLGGGPVASHFKEQNIDRDEVGEQANFVLRIADGAR